MIDLHMHSTFSDGSLTPAQLVEAACEIGLTAMALTDHDSTGGLDQFLAACARQEGPGRVEGIPGVEISAAVSRGTMHMLGYFMDRENADLQAVLAHIRDGRETRNVQILQRLNELGLELTWDEVKERAGEEVVGRPHFSQAMIARGYVHSTSEAFNTYLAKGKPAYVDRFRLLPADAIAAIRGAGGVPVLSHPFTLEPEGGDLKKLVQELTDAGLQGIEVHYSEHNAEQTREYLGLASEFDLAVTGGSDFHGEINPKVRIGKGFGSLNVPDELVEGLKARARAA